MDSSSSTNLTKTIAELTKAIARIKPQIADLETAISAAQKKAQNASSTEAAALSAEIYGWKAALNVQTSLLSALQSELAAAKAANAKKLAEHGHTQLSISDGSRCTLSCGDRVHYTNLPNQLLVAVVCNNTQENQTVHFSYAGQNISKQVATPAQQEFSIGCCYIINPALAYDNDLSISLSGSAQKDATVDVYLISNDFPSGNKIQDIHIDPFSDNSINLSGNSKLSLIPAPTWYVLHINSSHKGLVSLFFNSEEHTLQVLGANMPNNDTLAPFIISGPGTDHTTVHIQSTTASKLDYGFFGGYGSNMVFHSIAPVNATNIGTMSVYPS